MSGAASPQRGRPDVVLVVAALLLAAAVYLPHLGNGFVYDDRPQVLENPVLADGASWLAPFRADLWQHLRGAQGTMNSYYRPLLYVAYRLVGGADAPAWRFHLLGFLAHVAAGLLGWRLAARLGAGRMVAAGAAAIFLLHPLASEAVYAIADLCDQLLLLFLLGAVRLAIGEGRPGAARVAGVAAATAGALLSKETGLVVAPLVTLALLDLRNRPVEGRVALLAATWVPTLLYFPVRSLAAPSIDLGGLAPDLVGSLGRAGLALGWYVRAFLAPFPLTPFPPFPAEVGRHPLDLPGIALLGLLAVGVGFAARHPALRLRLAWVLLPLLPTLIPLFVAHRPAAGLVVAERYAYVPLFAAALLLAGAVARIPRRAVAGGAATAIGLLLLGALPVVHNYGRAFRSDEAFFRRALEHHPRAPVALSGLGSLLLERGDLAGALDFFERAVAEEPRSAAMRLNLGIARLRAGDRRGAIADLSAGLDLDEGFGAAHRLLADALREEGRMDEAGEHYRRAAELTPNDPAARLSLGTLLYVEGNLTGARAEWEAVVRLVPGSPEAWFNLGMVCDRLGDPAAARTAYESFLRVAPDAFAPQRERARAWLAADRR